ncbi:bacterial transferase hexapeptide repeat domain protein [Shigella sonnei 3226-85]|nr:bacterial transferase hexapeptide repeat domain protein [Shigella sonnei 3226-85]
MYKFTEDKIKPLPSDGRKNTLSFVWIIKSFGDAANLLI